MKLIDAFKQFLLTQKNPASPVTVKNYLADVRKFVVWFEEYFSKQFAPQEVSLKTIETFKASISQAEGSVKSIERYQSSLRKFFRFLKLEGIIPTDPFDSLTQPANEDPLHLKSFKNFLYVYNASTLTIKNYLIDIKQFFTWAQTVFEETPASEPLLSLISPAVIEEYRQRLLEERVYSPTSINRKLSSLRKYFAWAVEQGIVTRNPFEVAQTQNHNINIEAILATDISGRILEKQSETVYPTQQVYSAIPPVRLAQKSLSTLDFLIEKIIITPAVSALNSARLFIWHAQGKPVFTRPTLGFSLKPGQKFARAIKNFPKEFYAPLDISINDYPWYKKVLYHLRFTRPNWYRKYHSYAISHYFNLAVLFIFCVIIGTAMYSALINGGQKSPSLAASPTAPLRILSFQGRLTDNLDNPITTARNLRFTIYSDSSASGSARLWEEVDNVGPDQDGIFSVLLGSNGSGGNATLCNGGNPPTSPPSGSCGIPQSLFAQNAQLWLGVTVENGTELTPRQQLATVAYASNAETLQGLPPTTDSAWASAGTNGNAVLALTSNGVVNIAGSANAVTVIQATSSQIKLTGNVTTLATNTGSNGNVQVIPDGSGLVDIQKPLFNSTLNSNLRSASDNASSSAGAVEVDDLFAILATSSGQSAVTIDQDGVGPIISASHSGSPVFTVSAFGDTTIAGNTNISGNLTLNNSLSGNVSSNIIPTQNILYDLGSSSLMWRNIYAQNIFAPVTGGTSGFWQLNNGALAPANLTNDLLLGSTATKSATFGFINVGQGTPTATISAGNAIGAVYLTATGKLATTNAQNLTLGDAGTGNITLSPMGGTGAVSVNGGFTVSTFAQPGGVIYQSGANGQLSVNTAGSVGQCLISNGSSAPFWAACSSGSNGINYWTIINGALSTANNTADLLVGGNATASAKFAVLGVNTNSTVASVSAQNANNSAVYLDAGNNAIQTVRNQNLTIGGATTGNIFLSPLGGTNGLVTINGNLALSTFTNQGGIVYQSGTNGQVAVNTAGSLNQCLVSGGTGAPTWATCATGAAGVNWWNLQNGALNTINNTADLLVGGTSTASAHFAVLNVNTNTTIASVSAQNANNSAVYLDAGNNAIQTVRNQNLTLGGSTTGNITLSPLGGTGIVSVNGTLNAPTIQTNNIFLPVSGGTDGFWQLASNVISPSNTVNDLVLGGNATASAKFHVFGATGNVAIGTTTISPLAALDARVISNTAPVASLSGNTSASSLVVDQTGSGNIFTAQQAGGTRFAIANNGTLTSSKYITAGGVIYTDGSGNFQQTLQGTNSQCLIGGSVPAWTTCAFGTNWWSVNNGTLFPINNTLDFLVGGTATTSSHFAITGVNTNTTTASLSAQNAAGNALSLNTVAGSIQTANNQNLTIGGSTTGNITLSPLNGGTGSTLTINANTIALGGTNTVISNTGSNTLTLNNGSTGNLQFFNTNNTLSSTGNLTLAGNITLPNSNTLTGVSNFVNFNNGVGLGSTTGAPTYFLNTATSSLNSLQLANNLYQPVTGGISGYFQLGNNVIAPSNTINDLAIGGNSTASAKFQIYGATGNATTSGTLTFNNVAGSIQTTNTKNLMLGGASTGNIFVSPFNSVAGGFVAPGANSVTDLGQSTLNFRNVFATTYNSGTNVGQSLTNASCVNTTGGIVTGVGSCGVQDWWTMQNGLLYPVNSTLDLAVGGSATTSAIFAVTGSTSTGASAFPTASVSATTGNFTGNGIILGGNGSIQSLRNNNLVIGGATTGNITLSPLNGGTGSTLTINANTIALGGTNTVISNTGSNTLTLNNGSTGNLQFFGSSNYITSTGTLQLSGNIFQPVSGGTSGYWQLASNVVAPSNLANDLAVGGNATGSATPFQVFAETVGLRTAGTATSSGNLSFRGANTKVSLLNGGSLGFYTSNGGDTGIGNPSLFIANAVNGTAGSVGINTNAPTAFLDVNGAASVSGSLTFHTGAGSIQTTSSSPLTIGGSTTGPITLSGLNGAANGITFQGYATGIIHSTSGLLTSSAVNLASADVTGILPLANGGTNNNLSPSNGGIVYSDATKLQILAGTSTFGQCLISGINAAPSWATCSSGAAGTNYWTNALGAIFPINATLDVLIGGSSTSSAKFAFVNNAGGTPTASISAQDGTGKALVLVGNGTIQTVNSQPLTLGGSTTGNIVLSPTNGTGNIALNAVNITDSNITTNFLNSGVTTLNIGGAATTLVLGAGTGETLIHNKVSVDGGTLDSGQSTFSMLPNPATVNFGFSTQADNFLGNVTIGSSATNTATFKAGITGSGANNAILPISDGTVDLGSSTVRYNNVFAYNFSSPVGNGTSGFWTITNNTNLYPSNTADDLLLGGTGTGSASFQVFANAFNNGTSVPAGTASTSGNLTFRGTNVTHNINAVNGGSIQFQTAITGEGDTGLAPVLTIANNGNITFTGGSIDDSTATVNLFSTPTTLTLGSAATAISIGKNNSGFTEVLNEFRADQNYRLTGNLLTNITPNTNTLNLGTATTPFQSLFVTNVSVPVNSFDGYWQMKNNVLSPQYNVSDLAIGGTATGAATFQIFAQTGSATSSGNFIFGGTATSHLIAARNAANLTIGDSQTGLLTLNGFGTAITGTLQSETHSDSNLYLGDISSSPRVIFGGSTTHEIDNLNGALRIFRPGITPDFAISSTGSTGLGMSVASIGNAGLAVNQTNASGLGDIFTASAAGTPEFTVANDGSIKNSLVPNLIGASGIDTLYNLGSATAEWDTLYVRQIITPANGGGVAGYWQLTNTGILAPANLNNDLAIGGTTNPPATGSAVFQVFANSYSNNAGTVPAGTASMSGNLVFTGKTSTQTLFQADLLNNSQLGFYNSVGGDTGITSVTPALFIGSTGSIGLGTNNPQNKLHLFGSTPTIETQNTLTNPSDLKIIPFSDGAIYFEATTNRAVGGNPAPIYFTDNFAQDPWLTIQKTGAVGIGTTTPVALTGLDIEKDSGGASSLIVNQKSIQPNVDIMTASSSGFTKMRLDVNGNLYASKFIDLDNTASQYYLDPANSGTSLVTAGRAGIGNLNPNAKLELAWNNQVSLMDGNSPDFISADDTMAGSTSTYTPIWRVTAQGANEQLGGIDTPFGGLGFNENRLAYSEQFSNPAWQGYCQTPATIQDNTTDVQAPDGTYTANKSITHATLGCGNSQDGYLQLTSPTLSIGQPYTVSVWIRGATGTEVIGLGVNDSNKTGNVTVTKTWKRYTYTTDSLVTTSDRGFQLQLRSASATYYIWGAQLEQRNYAGTYIATTNPVVPSPAGFNSSLVVNATGSAVFGGRVAIGTTSAQFAPLQTEGVIGNTLAEFGDNTSGISLIASYPTIGFNSYFNGGFLSQATGYGGYIQLEQSSGAMLFATAGTVTGSGTSQTMNERMRITNDGNVGIGASPGTKLYIMTTSQASDGIQLNGTDNHFIREIASAGGGAFNSLVGAGDEELVYSNGSAGTGALNIVPWSGCSGGCGIHMDSSGNVGIGTSPNDNLTINGGADFTGSQQLLWEGGGANTYLAENWGVGYQGDSTHPFAVRAAGLVVGFTATGSTYNSGEIVQLAPSSTISPLSINPSNLWLQHNATTFGVGAWVDTSTNGSLVFSGYNSGSFTNNLLTLDRQDATVGVNSLTPTAKLSITAAGGVGAQSGSSANGIEIDSGSNYDLYMGADTTLGGYIQSDKTGTGVQTLYLNHRGGKVQGGANCTNLTGGTTAVFCSDYAEYYNANMLIGPAEIVSPDTTSTDSAHFVTDSTKPYDASMIGVVSTTPAVIIDDGQLIFGGDNTTVTPSNKPPVASAGRVPVEFISTNGFAHVGDAITSAGIAGFGMKATKAGPIVGKVIEDFDPLNGKTGHGIINCPANTPSGSICGKVMVLLNISWYDPNVYLTTTGDMNITNSLATPSANVTVPQYYTIADAAGNAITRMGGFLELAVGNLRAGSIQAQQTITNTLAVATDNVSIAGQSLHDYIASVVREIVGNNTTTSPLAQNGTIAADVISPLSQNSSISATLTNNQFSIHANTSSTSAVVAAIDNSGNATFSGQLASNGLAVNGDATISGTLHADKIEANDIVGLQAILSTLSAQNVTNVTTISFATPSSYTQATGSGTGQILSSNGQNGVPTTPSLGYVNLASYSGFLAYVPKLEAATAQFDQGIISLGPSSLADTSINGQLSIGSQMILSDNTLNVLGSDLEIQPLRQGGVDFLAGAVKIDKNGDLTVNGKAVFNGGLYANIISPLAGSDLNVILGSAATPESDSKFNIKNSSGSAVLTVNSIGDIIASGAATVSKLNLNPVQEAQAISQTEIIATSSAGTAVVNAYQKEITIDTPFVTAKSLIYITPIGDATSGSSSQTPFLLRQVPGQSFTVGVNVPVSSDTKFNWLIIN